MVEIYISFSIAGWVAAGVFFAFVAVHASLKRGGPKGKETPPV